MDVLAIGVYQAKGLHATTALFAVFLVMATSGWIAWRRAFDDERRAARASA